MKQIILVFAFMGFFTAKVKAQKIYYDQMRKRHQLCAGTIVGISTMGSGVFLALAGALLDYENTGNQAYSGSMSSPAQYEADHKSDVAIRNIGLGLFLAGGIVFIAGRSYDDKHKNDHKISLVAPKKNEIGLAYNF